MSVKQSLLIDLDGLINGQARLYHTPPSFGGIYALIDPLDGKIKYVGSSKNIKNRFDAHMTQFNLGNKKSNWIIRLIDHGVKPHVVLLEKTSCDKISLLEKESRWIDHFRQMGADLLNGDYKGRKKGSVKFDENEMRVLYKQGMSIKSISSKLKCSTKTVQRALRSSTVFANSFDSDSQGVLFHETL